MAIPVPIPGGPLAISDLETASGELLLTYFVQLLAAGTSGATLTTPPATVPIYPPPPTGPTTKVVLLDTAEKQAIFRHLCIALARSSVLQSQTSTTPGADLVVKAFGTGLIAPGWFPLATAVLRGAVLLSSAPAGTATALNSEEVTTTPTANMVPRADGAGRISTSWVIQDIWNEVPTGLINSSNTVYTTANTFRSGTTRVHLNGIRQRPTTHYTESAGNTITFVSAPTTGAYILVDYSR